MNKPRNRLYRLFEILPGLLLWSTFILAIILSFVAPQLVIYFIILFSLYWLFRVIYFVFYVTLAWRNYRRDIKINWQFYLKSLPKSEKIYHLIFLPTYKEPLEVLRTTFEALKDSFYDKQKMIVVLAGEERDQDRFEENAKAIEKEFGHLFYRLLITLHPDNIAGEMKGKGANAHYAGHQAKRLIDQMGISYQDIIVSYFDIDTVVHPQYFACLSYKYLTHPNPTKTSFQPVVLYSNNIWDAPAVTRVAAFGTTFWLMSELVRPDRLFTFSSHSMSFKALVDVNFWQKDIVTDDSRIFLQCFVHYHGDYSVTPMFVPVSMDTVMAKKYYQSLINLYKQQRRWAWGIEHFPYMVWNFFCRPNQIPISKKIKYLFNLSEGMYSWAATPILLLFLGRLPLWAAPPGFKSSLLAFNAPVILQWLMSLAMVGILFSALVSLMLLPPTPTSRKSRGKMWMVLQWLLLPFTLIIFGSIPAADAQTRLMLGRYLGFWVTEKSRFNSEGALLNPLSRDHSP